MIATPIRIYLTNGTVSHELLAGQRACCGRWLAGYRREAVPAGRLCEKCQARRAAWAKREVELRREATDG